MALTAEVTKIWPTLETAGQIEIGVLVVLKEDSVEVLRRTFTTNTEKTGDPEIKATEICQEINSWIADYKFEKTAYNHAKMDAFETAITEGVEL